MEFSGTSDVPWRHQSVQNKTSSLLITIVTYLAKGTQLYFFHISDSSVTDINIFFVTETKVTSISRLHEAAHTIHVLPKILENVNPFETNTIFSFRPVYQDISPEKHWGYKNTLHSTVSSPDTSLSKLAERQSKNRKNMFMVTLLCRSFIHRQNDRWVPPPLTRY